MNNTEVMMDKFIGSNDLQTVEGWEEFLLTLSYHAGKVESIKDDHKDFAEISEKDFAQAGFSTVSSMINKVKTGGLNAVHGNLELEFLTTPIISFDNTVMDVNMSEREIYRAEFNRVLLLKVKVLLAII